MGEGQDVVEGAAAADELQEARAKVVADVAVAAVGNPVAEIALIAKSQYQDAMAALSSYHYQHGKGRIPSKYYEIGQHALDRSAWNSASAAFQKAGAYADAGYRAVYAVIRKDEGQLPTVAEKEAMAALAERYAALGACLDSADRAANLIARADAIATEKLSQVDQLIAQEQYQQALKILSNFGSYGREPVPAKCYAIGEAMATSGDWVTMLSAYRQAGTYLDAPEKAALYAQRYNPIQCGWWLSYGLCADGTIVVVGDNSKGQFKAQDWRGIVSLAVSNSHTVGLRADGTVVAVGGKNYYGQNNVSDWRDIVAIAAKNVHTVGLRSDGTVLAIGKPEDGQCNVSGWTEIVAIAAGYNHTIGLRADGTVVAVGNNDYGQCDVSSWTDIIAITAGGNHTVGLRRNGTVVSVGENFNPKYGKPTFSSSEWTDIVAITADGYNTIGLRRDGTVVASGPNTQGRCDVSDWKDIVAISIGNVHTLGMHSDGTVVATGPNTYGECNTKGWDLVD